MMVNREQKSKIVDGIIIAVVLGLFGLAFFSAIGPDPLEQHEGEPAPPFKLENAAGEAFGPSDHLGKIVLVDFWATWCRPCIKQMPAIAALETDEALTEDFVVLSVNVDDPGDKRQEQVDALLERGDWEFDVLYDDGRVQQLYGIQSIPTLVLIRPDGIVHYAGSGVHSEERLRELVDEARGEAL